MSASPDPLFESNRQGISLDELAEAFAQVMGVEPRPPVEPPAAPDGATDSRAGESSDAAPPGDVATPAVAPAAPVETPDVCPISPRSILEAMLFVGNRDNQPLAPARAAELMRDVAPEEIPAIVDELNRCYAARDAACRIVAEANGYRLVLRDELGELRNRFFGRLHETRLSQAAIDVLALVAYRQPVTGEQVRQWRDKPSNHVLAHLVRRGLLRVDRLDPKRRTPHYSTTERFLRLFGLETLDDLPRTEDATPP